MCNIRSVFFGPVIGRLSKSTSRTQTLSEKLRESVMILTLQRLQC